MEMLGNWKVWLAGAVSIISLLSYLPYMRDCIRKRTRPHIFTWVVFAMLTAIAWWAQVQDGAGPGAWITLTTLMFCVVISVFAIPYGEKTITRSDWLSFGGAWLAVLLWVMTDDATWSLILVLVIDALAFYPTFRKTYYKPNEETLVFWIIGSLKFAVALVTLDNWTFLTWGYPLYLLVVNGGFTIFMLVRRRQLQGSLSAVNIHGNVVGNKN